MSEKAADADLERQLELARLQAEVAIAKARAAEAELETARLRGAALESSKNRPASSNANGNGHDHGAATAKVPAESIPAAKAPPVAAMPAAVGVRAPNRMPAVAPLSSKAATAKPQAALAEVLEAEPRHLLSRGLIYQFGAWTTSMLIHMGLLLCLAMWMIPHMLKPDPPLLEALQLRDEEMVTQVLDEQKLPSTELAVSSQAFNGLPTGQAAAIEGSAEPTFDKEVSDAVEGPKVNVGDVDFASVPGKSLNLDVPEGSPGNPQAVVDSYQEAMDRITQEILMMLLKNKVLVVWCFDESESMKDDQKEIRDKIERVYVELGLTKATQGDALLTAVCSFGEKFTMHTKKPTSDLNEIREAIDAVKVDETGKENLTYAVGETVNQYKNFARQGRRQLAMIVVTDESGDPDTNVSLLERAIAEAKSARCRLYFLGREAVFGYPYAFMRWTEPTQKLTYWLQIDRGPETPGVEQLQTNGFYRRHDAHPSGFGPYEQARMARETDGIFFMLPSPEVNLVGRDNRKYAIEAIRPYMPDLDERNAYIHERNSSELRRKIYEVIEKLNPYNPVAAPHIIMRHHFSIKPPEFEQQVRSEQTKAKNYILYLHEREKEMETLQKLRNNETYPRWQANYDLIYAQIIAYKVRMYEYGAYLEDFVKNPKPVKNPLGPNRKSTHWELGWRQQLLTEKDTATYIAKSKELFAKVMKDHPGTPWAARAQDELKRGFGVDLHEDYDDPRRNQGVKVPKL